MPIETVAGQHLWPLITGIEFAMFNTNRGNARLHSPPTKTRNKATAEYKLWIFMSAHYWTVK